jgi:hypothetical protein
VVFACEWVPGGSWKSHAETSGLVAHKPALVVIHNLVKHRTHKLRVPEHAEHLQSNNLGIDPVALGNNYAVGGSGCGHIPPHFVLTWRFSADTSASVLKIYDGLRRTVFSVTSVAFALAILELISKLRRKKIRACIRSIDK